MLKKYLYFPLSAGVFGALVTILYSFAYESAWKIEGEQLESLREAIPVWHLILAPTLACFVAAAGYFTLKNYLPKSGPFLFYFFFSSVSIFTSFAIFTVYGLHEEVQYIVAGYSMPMHFFPFLSWVTFKSLFFQD